MIAINEKSTRRSNLCDTCGDTTVKNPTQRVLLYILVVSIIGVAGFFSFYTFSNQIQFFIVYPIFILVIIFFEVFLISAMSRSEKA